MIKESIEQKKIIDLLVKYGNKIKDSKLAVKKHYKKAKSDRSGASPAQLAQYISYLAIDEEITENKGLWHNIRAKKARGEKSSPKGSKAYKAAKAAGDKINKMKEEAYDLWAEDGSFGYTMTGIVEAEYQGRKVKLGKPMQGDVKKFKVYVKNPKGNVVKVNFGQGGDAKGGTMKIRKSNPEARKSFRARHNCDNPGPRHKARYWSCKKW